VEIRGSTVKPTRKYGEAYAEVRNDLRGGTTRFAVIRLDRWKTLLRGGTVASRVVLHSPCTTVMVQSACSYAEVRYANREFHATYGET